MLDIHQRYMENTLKETYATFKNENPNDKISFQAFAKLKPEGIKSTNCIRHSNCKCEYCIKVNLGTKATF